MSELQVQKREILGKKVKALRQQGFLPAELYGHKVGNEHVSVSKKDFKKIFEEVGESTIVNLILDGQKIPVLIYGLQSDNLTGEVSHVDFLAVKMDEKIKTGVELEFTGEAPAVKEKGGVLVKAMQEVEVEALPGDLPRNIEVSLAALAEIGQSICVGDLKVSDKVKVLTDAETVVATITELVEEKEEAPAVDISEIKTEAEEKKAEQEKEEPEETQKQ